MLGCVNCKHRKWEEGDYDYSPPGWGTYYCELTDKGLTEAESKSDTAPELCPKKESNGTL